jgi:hypothetical protein
MNTRTALRALAHYVGKVQTIRNERRALDSLPASLRKDIGWPDRYQRHG